MAIRFCLRLLLPLAAVGLGAMLGGCVAYPAYPAYSAGYGYAPPYYGGGYVGFGGGWHDHAGYRRWHDRDGGWWR